MIKKRVSHHPPAPPQVLAFLIPNCVIRSDDLSLAWRFTPASEYTLAVRIFLELETQNFWIGTASAEET